MAGWFSMPSMLKLEGGHGSCHLVPVLQLSASDLGDGGHDFPRHAQAFGDVVSGNVVCDEPEERSQRAGVAACARAGWLRDGLDLVAQVETGDGPARPRSAE